VKQGVATALSLCASFASGVKANFGKMAKPLHVGHTARNGVMAALLAEQEFTANDGVFEHPQGFLNVYNDAGNFDDSKLLDGWANPFNIVRPGLAIKQPGMFAWQFLTRKPPICCAANIAFAVTTGVTFTSGGVKISHDAQIEDTSGNAIRGLSACGEMVGGLFYPNYASGTGLMSGAVFGRKAGNAAARAVLSN
jgi:hypothetical protein